MISEKIRTHLAAPCTGYLGTCNAERIPHVARAHGWRVDEDGKSLHVLVPPAFADAIEADLKANGHVSFVIGNLLDMETFQFKGPLMSCGALTEPDVAAYRERTDATVQGLMKLGLPEPVVRRAYDAPSLVVRFEVRDVFVQTPGPGAGEKLSEGKS